MLETDGPGGILNLPIDLALLITLFLEPLDLLQLSRTSRAFRLTFLSRNVDFVWRQAKLNACGPGAPELPPDMSDPQFCALVFEDKCTNCHMHTARGANFEFGQRFCSSCGDKRIVNGRKVKKVPKEIYKLLPQAITVEIRRQWKSMIHQPEAVFDQWDVLLNEPSDRYYRPALVAAQSRYQELMDDGPSLQTFVEDQRRVARRMLKFAVETIAWMSREALEKADTERKIITERTSIAKARLKDLGWNDQLLGYEFWELKQIFEVPVPMTDDVWLSLLPTFDILLEDAQRRAHHDNLTFGIEAKYESPYNNLPPDIYRLAPTFDMLPSWSMFNHPGFDDNPETEEFYESMCDELLAQYWEGIRDLKVDFASMFLAAAADASVSDVSDADIREDDTKLDEVVNRAAAVCCLGGEYSLQRFLDVVYSTRFGFWDNPSCPRALVQMAMEALTALGLPRDASMEQLHGLEESADPSRTQLVCMCGRGVASYSPMQFEAYVSGIYVLFVNTIIF
ncbi:hypothetical protein HGRIS_002102 [Hohenbuehelia grisea]|uniref:F-box domain-containing protein n=1 Tax=Hohenbuehelia grisea TaxID=104357 RepID=A0ABR3JK46_9AGAR